MLITFIRVSFTIKAITRFMFNKTVFDTFPIVVFADSVIQPIGVVTEANFVNKFSGTFIGDYESKNTEEGKKDDEEHHDDQIELDETCDTTKNTNETSE